MWDAVIIRQGEKNPMVKFYGSPFKTEQEARKAIRDWAIKEGYDQPFWRYWVDEHNFNVQWIDFGSWSIFGRIEFKEG